MLSAPLYVLLIWAIGWQWTIVLSLCAAIIVLAENGD